MAHNFENIGVWKRASQLAVDIYIALQHFKDFNLKDQIQRAAISIPSNIAEGSARGTDKDFIRFLRTAKGSSAELRTQLYILKKLQVTINLPSVENIDGLISETLEINSMIEGFIKQLD